MHCHWPEKEQELYLLSSPHPHMASRVSCGEAAVETGWWAGEDELASRWSRKPAEDGISLSWVPTSLLLIDMHSKAFEETLIIVTGCPHADGAT